MKHAAYVVLVLISFAGTSYHAMELQLFGPSLVAASIQSQIRIRIDDCNRCCIRKKPCIGGANIGPAAKRANPGHSNIFTDKNHGEVEATAMGSVPPNIFTLDLDLLPNSIVSIQVRP